MLDGFSESHARRIEAARENGPFRSLEDFAQRTGLSRAVVTRLAKAGAFGSLKLNRRASLWQALAQDGVDLPLFRDPQSDAPPRLPAMSPAEEIVADYRTAGLSLQGHPLALLREGLDRLGVVPASMLATWPDGKPVRVAGIVLVRQRPGTAKGITFVTLEDETATANLIIRPDVWQRFRASALRATILLAQGRLQRQGLVIHVLVTRLEDISNRFRALASQSRDFS